MYPLRYIEDFFAKPDEVAARIALPVAEDTFETSSSNLFGWFQQTGPRITARWGILRKLGEGRNLSTNTGVISTLIVLVISLYLYPLTRSRC